MTESEDSWVSSEEAQNLLIQFRRLERQLEGLPGVADGVPDSMSALMLGVSEEKWRRAVDFFDDEVSGASAQLRTRAGTATQVERARSAWSGRRIVCVGDSITADRRSWAEMLSRVLAPEVEVLNRGRGGDNTTDILSRFRTSVGTTNPDLVIFLIGTNDVRRYRATARDENPGAMLVSDEATRVGCLELDRLSHILTGRHPLWIAPPPVSPVRLRQHPAPLATLAHWDEREIRAKGAIMRELFGSRCADLRSVLGTSPSADHHLMPDGLHPNLAGQVAIASEILRLLGTCDDRIV